MLRRAWRSLASGGISDQSWVASKELRHPFAACASPNQFEQAEEDQRFATCQKECRDHVARPMGPQVNSRIADGQSDKPVKRAAASVKQSAKHSNHTV